MSLSRGDRARGEDRDRSCEGDSQHEDERFLRRLHAPRVGREPGAVKPEGGA